MICARPGDRGPRYRYRRITLDQSAKPEMETEPAPAAASPNNARQPSEDPVRVRAHDVGVEAVAQALADAA